MEVSKFSFRCHSPTSTMFADIMQYFHCYSIKVRDYCTIYSVPHARNARGGACFSAWKTVFSSWHLLVSVLYTWGKQQQIPSQYFQDKMQMSSSINQFPVTRGRKGNTYPCHSRSHQPFLLQLTFSFLPVCHWMKLLQPVLSNSCPVHSSQQPSFTLYGSV